MRKLSDLTNRIVSSSASLVAVVALGTSLYEARLNREQQRAAVWPYVEQSNTGTGTAHYRRIVRNVGVGPAKVRSFQVWTGGRPRHGWREVFDSIGAAVTPQGYTHSGLGPGFVLVPNETVEVLDMTDSASAVALGRVVDKLDTRVCYCSLYDECWIASSASDEPQKVKACADDPKLDFYSVTGKR